MANRTLRARAPAAAAHAGKPRNRHAGTKTPDWHFTKRPDMTWHDHLVMLLHVAAEIEHALMVQYLYAAYSLGGEQVPQKHWPMVKSWQKSILAIAKEEMGHLLTVQNLLTALGGPVNLARQNFPWDMPYYPFPFKLEPFTLDSLSCYVYAEMPADSAFRMPGGKRLPKRYRDFEQKEKKAIEIRARARVPDGAVHRVGTIYDEILHIIEDPVRIPDSLFQEDTYSVQASWDDWGRGYRSDPYLLDAQGSRLEPEEGKAGTHPRAGPPSMREAHVRIDRIATRTQALAALSAISGQGEAPHLKVDDTGEPSHFDRFLEIYGEFEKKVTDWAPSRDVAVDPTILEDPKAGNHGDFISAKPAHDWAKLFNLRYRLLLAYLAHTFRLARVTRPDEPNLRAMVMHKVFGEMYNLKTIATVLVRLRLRDLSQPSTRMRESAIFAGPPFEVPYSLRLPPSESDAWHLHRELLGSSALRCADILPLADADGRRYLGTLLELDRQSIASIDRILAGSHPVEKGRI